MWLAAIIIDLIDVLPKAAAIRTVNKLEATPNWRIRVNIANIDRFHHVLLFADYLLSCDVSKQCSSVAGSHQIDVSYSSANINHWTTINQLADEHKS